VHGISYRPTDLSSGMSQSLKIWGAGSNAARRRCQAAPSDLPKYGGAAAPPLLPPSDMPDPY
jgi:hypothetical protein